MLTTNTILEGITSSTGQLKVLHFVSLDPHRLGWRRLLQDRQVLYMLKWRAVLSNGAATLRMLFLHLLSQSCDFVPFFQPAHNDKTAHPEVARLMKELIKSRKQLKGQTQKHSADRHGTCWERFHMFLVLLSFRAEAETVWGRLVEGARGLKSASGLVRDQQRPQGGGDIGARAAAT